MKTLKVFALAAFICVFTGCATRNDGSSPNPAESNDTDESGTPSNGLAPEDSTSQQDSKMQPSDSTSVKSNH